MAEPTVAMPETHETTAVAPATPQQMAKTVEETRQRESYITPPVDIYETPESLVVLADMPGIDPAQLEVRVDNNVLTLHGQTRHSMPGTMAYQEYTLVSFFRQFELSERIEQDAIRAEFKHGVLTLTLPKAAKAKPRAITVNVA
jgi:HSP20 family protein